MAFPGGVGARELNPHFFQPASMSPKAKSLWTNTLAGLAIAGPKGRIAMITIQTSGEPESKTQGNL
jgi:hypothetical protein